MNMTDDSAAKAGLPGLNTEKMQASQFLQLTGMRVVSAGERKAVVELAVTDKLLQGLGIMHGGMLGGLIDSAIGAAVLGELHGKGRVVTIEDKINFYRPARLGDLLTARAEVLHLGRATAAGEARVTDQDGNLVGHGTATFMRVTSSFAPTTSDG
jgi:uncharacterized protein (TIGR00369 family)